MGVYGTFRKVHLLYKLHSVVSVPKETPTGLISFVLAVAPLHRHKTRFVLFHRRRSFNSASDFIGTPNLRYKVSDDAERELLTVTEEGIRIGREVAPFCRRAIDDVGLGWTIELIRCRPFDRNTVMSRCQLRSGLSRRPVSVSEGPLQRPLLCNGRPCT